MDKISFTYNGKKKNIKFEKAFLKIYELKDGSLDILQYNLTDPEPISIGKLLAKYVHKENGEVIKES